MKAIITGSSRGIGKAIALKFAASGYDVFLTARSADGLQQLKSEINTLYPAVNVQIYSCDLTHAGEVDKFAAFCLKEGAPDILINNAGTYEPGNCKDDHADVLKRMMDVNFFSAYYVTKAFLPAMIANGKGHIFFNCSIASLKAYKGGGYYGVSKYALHGFSKNLRLELMEHNIKVTAVFSGAVMTDSWGDFDNSDGRIMVVEDLAQMIFTSTQLSPQACVEDIIIRPQLGDLN
jgi:short-subunit dehydrogenase